MDDVEQGGQVVVDAVGGVDGLWDGKTEVIEETGRCS